MGTTKENFLTRKKRVKEVLRNSDRPRLAVFRSNRFIYAQIIDDKKGRTLVAVSSRELKEKKTTLAVAQKVGEALAQKAKKKKIKAVVFDRSGYKYHGQVRALAEGARKGGLLF